MGDARTGPANLAAGARVVPSSAARVTHVGSLLLVPTAARNPRWLPTFGQQPGADGAVRAFAVFDDGDGPALVAAGEFPFSAAGDSYVAKWGCGKEDATGELVSAAQVRFTRV